MKLDTDLAPPGVDCPRAFLEQPALPGALVHGLLAAASSVTVSATRALAGHRLTVPEHALLSRLAGGARDNGGAPDIALLSLHERGLVRHRGDSSRSAVGVELTATGQRQLADADEALRHIESRMRARIASWGPLAIGQILDELNAAATEREAAFR